MKTGSLGFVAAGWRKTEIPGLEPRRDAGGCARVYFKTVIDSRKSAAIGREQFTLKGNIDSKSDFEFETATQGRLGGVERKRKSC